MMAGGTSNTGAAGFVFRGFTETEAKAVSEAVRQTAYWFTGYWPDDPTDVAGIISAVTDALERDPLYAVPPALPSAPHSRLSHT